MIPKSIKHLAFLLKCKVTEGKLIEVANQLSNSSYLFDKLFYRQKEETKTFPNGKRKTRVLNPSSWQLKCIQSSIKRNILDKITFPSYIQGGLKGCSNVTNASLHLGNKYKFTTDIKSFFPSIKPDQVYQAFYALGCNPDTARILTLLTTFKGRLPQGTPTSSHIANLVFLPIDQEIFLFCQQRGITYTRYVDDVTLSSKCDFKSTLPAIIHFITNQGFNVSARKTQYRHILDITGIATKNNGLQPNRKFYERLEADQNFETRIARENYKLRVMKTKKKRTSK